MKQPQEIIADFIRLNSDSLNNMQKQAPEVAQAFAEVMKHLAMKYGNVPMPTSQGPVSSSQVTKEMILETIGDFISVNGKLYIITNVEFKDGFAGSFEVIITIRLVKRKAKNKALTFKLGLPDYYYTIPYRSEKEAYPSYTAKFNQDLRKEGLQEIEYKLNNVRNILSALPYYLFQVENKKYFDYYLYEISYYSKKSTTAIYHFTNSNSSINITISSEDIVAFLFNEPLNGVVGNEIEKLENQTYLVPILLNSPFRGFVEEALDLKAELIGLKIYKASWLNAGVSLEQQPQDFYTITELLDNKRKRKTFNTQNPSGQQKAIYIDNDDIIKIITNLYTGTSSQQDAFVQGPFDAYPLEVFVKRLRSYSSDEWRGLNNYYLKWQNRADSQRALVRLYSYQEDIKNKPEEFQKLFGFFENPVYYYDSLEQITFEYNSYNDTNIYNKLVYLLDNSSDFYIKNSSNSKEIFRGYSSLKSYGFITYLGINDWKAAFYYENLRKLQDLPFVLKKGAFVRIKDLLYPGEKAELNIFEKFEHQILTFTYKKDGKKGENLTRTLTVKEFFEAYDKEKYGIIADLENFHIEESYEFLVGETYPFYFDQKQQFLTITDRYLQGKYFYVIIENKYKMEYQEVNSIYNPENIKPGDEVKFKDNVRSSIALSNWKDIKVLNIKSRVGYGDSITDTYVEIEGDDNTGSRKTYSYVRLNEITKVNQSTTNPVPTSNTTIIENLEVYNEDLGTMTWNEATKKVSELGDSWRLPTKEECENKLVLLNKSFFNKDWYWTSSQSQLKDYAYSFSFGLTTGFQEDDKENLFKVRPVREISASSKKIDGIENIKFKSNSEDEAKIFQTYVFNNGAKWEIGNKTTPSYLNYRYYYVDANKIITHGDMDETFEESPFREVTLEDLGISSLTNVSSNPTTSSSTFKVGDKIKVVNPNLVYTIFDEAFRSLNFKNKLENEFEGEIGDTGEIFAIANHPNSNVEMLAINLDSGKQILIAFDGVELVNQNTPTQTPKISIIQNIETIPQELSTQFYFDKNDGSRNSPTQKAGELKSLYKGTDYEKELLNTYFKGNDGLWYKINVEVGGVWKWRKADPQPQEPQTQNEPTLNTDYASMSQNELQQRVRDIKIAMEVFDEEDEEYKELKLELETINLYI